MLLFLVDLINIEIFRIPFSFFYSFYFILRSRATSKRLSKYTEFLCGIEMWKCICLYTGRRGGGWAVECGIWVRIDHLFSMGGVWFADFPGDRLPRK